MPTLDWLNRDAAFQIAKDVPYRLLEFVSQHKAAGSTATNIDEEKLVTTPAVAPTQDNLLIQGDNLEALKALLPLYRGQVKCIFIDPPYNTKSAFEHYDDNLEHAQWLTMMLPRLQLLRELLSADGSIWVTIDDNECHYLKVMMDEVFGRGNFVITFAWEKDKGRRNDTDISSAHDTVLLFARDRKTWAQTRNLLTRTESQKARYKNPDNDPRGVWLQGDTGTAKSGSEAARFEIQLPSGRLVQPPVGNFWRFSKESFDVSLRANRVYFGKDGNRLPVIKRYLSEVQAGVVPRSWWTDLPPIPVPLQLRSQSFNVN